jgi:hypothetical protein
LIYEEIPEFDRQNVLLELSSEDQDRIIMALLSAIMNGEDFEFSLELINKYEKHENEYVRGCAVECLGHLSRLYSVKLDERMWRRIINSGKEDTSEWVRGKANGAIDDIELFEGRK